MDSEKFWSFMYINILIILMVLTYAVVRPTFIDSRTINILKRTQDQTTGILRRMDTDISSLKLDVNNLKEVKNEATK